MTYLGELMTYYHWPENMKEDKQPTFDPKERFDINDERYYIPNYVTDCTLADLLNYSYLDISNGSLINVCSADEYMDTHCRNNVIISEKDQEFHGKTFEGIKVQSPLIHSTYGLSANALVELTHTLKIHAGINNHSYVRFCPELIFSLSDELVEELLRLDSDGIESLAKDWQKAVLALYEVDEPENVKRFRFGWITVYEHSHYTVEYFTDLLLNMHELLRSCDEREALYLSVDY
jgi:hypothetical protein